MNRRNSGSSLLAVFWLLTLLTLAVFGGLSFVVSRVESQTTQAQAFRADQLLEEGLALAAHPGIDAGDLLLEILPASEVESIEVRLESEGARFHLNSLLQTEDRDTLTAIFTAMGLEAIETDTLIDQLIDWIDSDDLPRLNGAERDSYEQVGLTSLPFDRPFQSLDEVAMVMGIASLEEVYPEWRDWFTLWSSTGKLDLNAAAANQIQVACQCSLAEAETLIRARNGPDTLPFTEDDLEFQTVSEALGYLGPVQLLPEVAERRLTVNEPVKRVAIVARVGDYGARREVVLSKEGGIQLHYWRDSVLP